MSEFEIEKALKSGLKSCLRYATDQDQKAAFERDSGNLECEEFHKHLAEANYRMILEVRGWGVRKCCLCEDECSVKQ